MSKRLGVEAVCQWCEMRCQLSTLSSHGGIREAVTNLIVFWAGATIGLTGSVRSRLNLREAEEEWQEPLRALGGDPIEGIRRSPHTSPTQRVGEPDMFVFCGRMEVWSLEATMRRRRTDVRLPEMGQ